MTTREKRYALIDFTRNQLDIAMRDLTEAAEIYAKTAETFKQYRLNGDYVCKEFHVNGNFYTLEKALDLLTSAQNAVISAEKQINEYKYASDENVEAWYMLMEVAHII